jgi:SAM-dependent methyltransferase
LFNKVHELLHAARLYVEISKEVYGASSHAFIDRCFWRIWRQGADPTLFNQLTAQLKEGRLTRFGVVLTLASMPQHKVAVTDWKHYSYVESLHMARCLMVRDVPAADVIVDVGGAAPASIQGALLVMGYQHCFNRLTIVDLPPQRRFGRDYTQADEESTEAWISTEMGDIRYAHGSMTDLSALESQTVDLVFSGQSIEHVSRDDARLVLQEARRVLKDQGILFLDTPNARLTRIQSPEAFIHPEHKVEYRPAELARMIEDSGFAIQTIGGICPMPISAQRGVFDPQELIRNVRLSDNPEAAYAFYIQAAKE